jgi:hypothetical protein
VLQRPADRAAEIGILRGERLAQDRGLVGGADRSLELVPEGLQVGAFRLFVRRRLTGGARGTLELRSEDRSARGPLPQPLGERRVLGQRAKILEQPDAALRQARDVLQGDLVVRSENSGHTASVRSWQSQKSDPCP